MFQSIERLPQVGETMEADNDVLKTFGGKGANTAVGCARLVSEETEDQEISVQMLGQLGTDNEGK
jgi:sugar/nucleoside kinase (ribokinase family)